MFHHRGLSVSAVCWLFVSALLFVAGATPSVVRAAIPLARRLAPLEDVNDLQVQSVMMFVVYVIQYLVLGGVFETTHPKGVLSSTLSPKHLAARREQVQHEIVAGVVSLAVTIGLSVAWMYAGEPRTYFYGYFETHAWSPLWLVGGLVAYVISFDTFFYYSHMMLHEVDFLWYNIHYFHHSYKEPSAFAQFAVHPVEAALQGPIGHFLVQLWFPVHPIQLAVMGFLSSAWAFAAHDGRGGDFNSHYFHHSKGRGRKHYFNLGFLTPVIDILMGTRWSEKHPLWVQWRKEERSGSAADTRDGSLSGVPNSTFLCEGKLAEERVEHQRAAAGKSAARPRRAPSASK